jgi:hypothetical protein
LVQSSPVQQKTGPCSPVFSTVSKKDHGPDQTGLWPVYLQLTTEVILDGPDTYYAWYTMIKTSVVKDLWKYVDSESAEEYEEPEDVKFDMVKEGARSLRELSNSEKMIYLNLKSDAKTKRLQYQRYLTKETKVRGKIMSTTTMAMKALL